MFSSSHPHSPTLTIPTQNDSFFMDTHKRIPFLFHRLRNFTDSHSNFNFPGNCKWFKAYSLYVWLLKGNKKNILLLSCHRCYPSMYYSNCPSSHCLIDRACPVLQSESRTLLSLVMTFYLLFLQPTEPNELRTN